MSGTSTNLKLIFSFNPSVTNFIFQIHPEKNLFGNFYIYFIFEKKILI